MYRKISPYIVFVLILIFSGCSVKNMSTNNLTMKISEKEISNNFKYFPIERDFIFAHMEVEKPKIFIKKGKKRIVASMDTTISSILLPRQSGTFAISGIPYFHSPSNGIYLKDIEVEAFDFQNTSITKELANMLLSNIQPIVNNIFKNFPIYTIKKSSFLGEKVHDIKIKDGELLIEYRMK